MENYLIRNCKFRYKCKQRWQGLDEIDPEEDRVRYCRVCCENVYLCETDEELLEAMRNNRCVALYEKPGDELPTMLGDVDTGYVTGGKLKWD
jgi:hypothetical protein